MTEEEKIALRINGMIMSSCASLDGLVHYMQNNLPEAEFLEKRRLVGDSMASLFEITNSILQKFPELTAVELLPPTKLEKS
jgi:hypothetical protein